MDQNALQVFAILGALIVFGVILTLPRSPVPKGLRPSVPHARSATPNRPLSLAEERLNRWSVRQVARAAKPQFSQMQPK